MKKVRRFVVSVTYRETDGTDREDTFPVQVETYEMARSVAFTYVLQILKLEDFELRIVGA
ncbi:MAG TPA: hypothetical protein VHC97_28285 [Thermoanaerobaculia bacterium]|nr:hypothetical protein [Thermoanaerobaculia bacterium]